ncbi:carboxymuconolactone decarboxylase family protein [Methylobacterium sp. Gmos1]
MSNHTMSNAMYDVGNLQKLAGLKGLAPEAMAAFEALDKAALADGAIPRKYKELMALAVALTTQCPYCLEVHREAAKKAGATEQELAETVFVAVALRAGAALTHGTHILP